MRARVIERRPDGSARVEVPVITITQNLDLSQTEGGGEGKLSFDLVDFAQMVENFTAWPKPVAVGFDGYGGHQGARNGPQSAFVDELSIHDDALFAVMDLNPFAASMVVNDRAFRGFSMEASRNPKTPTKAFRGWVLTGGVFTNNPATDTQFRIAATSSSAVNELATFTSPVEFAGASDSTEETKTMADDPKQETVSLSFHEQKLGALRDELTAKATEADGLRASLKSAEDKIATLEKEQANNRSDSTELSDKVATLTAKSNRLEAQLNQANEAKMELSRALNEKAEEFAELRSKTLGSEVKTLILGAIDAGVPPAIFDGWEGNPADWLASNYASIDAFKNFVTALTGAPKIPSGSVAKSGHDPKESSEPGEPAMTEEEKRAFANRGIRTDVDFRHVTNEEEARKRLAAAKEKANQK